MPNPFRQLLEKWTPTSPTGRGSGFNQDAITSSFWNEFRDSFYSGTTSVEAADKEGWVVSITPSGGWIPAVIAGKTGIGLSQRAQSFVLIAEENPFNVIEPGKLPRVTLTPSLALKDGKPFLSFAVQGGDSQDQNLLQFFLNVVEFGMNVQEAVEAPNINSFQMRSSFGAHESRPGRLLPAESVPPWTRAELRKMGFRFGKFGAQSFSRIPGNRSRLRRPRASGLACFVSALERLGGLRFDEAQTLSFRLLLADLSRLRRRREGNASLETRQSFAPRFLRCPARGIRLPGGRFFRRNRRRQRNFRVAETFSHLSALRGKGVQPAARD